MVRLQGDDFLKSLLGLAGFAGTEGRPTQSVQRGGVMGRQFDGFFEFRLGFRPSLRLPQLPAGLGQLHGIALRSEQEIRGGEDDKQTGGADGQSVPQWFVSGSAHVCFLSLN